MFGAQLILILVIMGGAIAFLGDKLGSKIGKKRLTIFGLRPHYTSILMTIITGVVVAAATMGILMVSSTSVRTALFGMEKIKTEIVTLNKDKIDISRELEEQKVKVTDLDKQIKQSSVDLVVATRQKEEAQSKVAELESSYQVAQEKLSQAQSQMDKLQASRDKLKEEVSSLETATQKLRENMTAMREGEVVFRSGEILYANVLKAGLSTEENQKQMDVFLAAANEHILERTGAKEDTQILWLSKESVKNALQALAEGKGNIYVRVCAAGNILSGEMAVSRLEMVPNNKVYGNNTEILSQRINVEVDSQQVEMALLAFLKDVNKAAVAKGVVADPLTGKVGAIDAAEMENVSTAIRKLGGKVEITAKAKGDIAVAGPVLLKLEVSGYE
ncbi:hypothetical protein SDC9_22557 [bioreactor metagenome]|uniref:Chromosome partition protein Smc n=1 Tax=bioreactor metagenome TaxID=1076179 RepID=A0A644UCX9_9ZZZZ|nr:DUF3084 domain-containing protein [Acidaminococcaceae bacterium]